MPVLKSSTKFWFYQAIGWGFYVIINSFFAYINNNVSSLFFKRLSVFAITGLIVTHFIRIVIKKGRILKWPFLEQISALGFILMISTILMGALCTFGNKFFHILSEGEIRLGVGKSYLQESFLCLIYLIYWILLYYIFHITSRVPSKRPKTI